MNRQRTWIWGRHPVIEAIRSGRAEEVLLETNRGSSPQATELQALAGAHRVPLRRVERIEIEKIALGESTQGVAARVVLPASVDLLKVLSALKGSASTPFLLALDQVQDPHNVGALLRTANAAGVHGVLLPDRRTSPISGAVTRVSAGAVYHVPLVEVGNLARALREAKTAGLWVAGLDENAHQSIYDADLTVPVVLAVGNEGEGLRRLTRDHCDFLLRVPMAGVIASLNASVAGAIAMYEIVRQRNHAAQLGTGG